MSRVVTVGAAQMGPIQRAESRAVVVERMLALLAKAHEKNCDLVVFPELALTTFFPRWYMEDQAEVDTWFESAMPSNDASPRTRARLATWELPPVRGRPTCWWAATSPCSLRCRTRARSSR